jgi:hypothetical protein
MIIWKQRAMLPLPEPVKHLGSLVRELPRLQARLPLI